jgi:competence protein ComEC
MKLTDKKIWRILEWAVVLLGLVLLYKFIHKDSLIGVINQSLPPKEAGLLGGMVFGEMGGFDKEFVSLLRNSGIIHLVVVSGSNIMLLGGGLIENLSKVLGRKRSIVFGIIVIWSYVFLVGFQIPAIRAAILISLYYWAQLLGRRYSIRRGLILTVALMLIADITILKQMSFWLSFSAFLAIVYKPKWKLNSILQVIMDTLWVSLWITPILGVNFGQISLVGFLSNALVLGLVETITLIGGIGAIIQSKLLLISIFPLLKYLIVVVESLGKLEWASISFRFNWFLVVGWYLLLGLYLYKLKANEN